MNQDTRIKSQENREWVILSYRGVNNTSYLNIDFPMESFLNSWFLTPCS
jgi:hypothetical protein